MSTSTLNLDLSKPLVLDASAGTGKTYAIEHIVVDLLLQHNLKLEQILVLTFTEKAATELRDRIQALLVKLLNSGEGAAVEEALKTFEASKIGTIHSFFYNLLCEHNFVGGFLFDSEMVKSADFVSQVFRNWLKYALESSEDIAQTIKAWVAKGQSIERLEDLLTQCLHDNQLLQPKFSKNKLSKALDQFDVTEFKLIEEVYQEANVRKNSLNKVLRTLRLLLDELKDWQNHANPYQFLFGLANFDFDTLLQPSCSKTAKTKWQFPDQLPEAVLRFKTRLKSLAASFVDPRAAAMQALVKEFLPFLEKHKHTQGYLDFDSMISNVLKIIDDKTQGKDFIDLLRSRYKAVLIDEFQDTDPQQWRFFKKVFLENPNNTKFILVGDPKQAIYGFRGADLNTYLEARNEVVATAGLCQNLEKNWRSSQNLIDALNVVFDQKAQQPFFESKSKVQYDNPVACGDPTIAISLQDPPIHVLQAVPETDKKNLTAAQMRRVIGKAIAQEIRDLQQTKIKVNDGKDSDFRDLQNRDIYVLTRTVKEAHEIASYLQEQNIPYAFYKQEGLFKTREAQAVRDLLKSLAYPQNRSHQLRALHSPFFDIPLSRLEDCEDLPLTHPISEKLMLWSQLSYRRNYAQLFTSIMEQSGLNKRLLATSYTQRKLTNYLHLFDLLLEHGFEQQADLKTLVRQLDNWIEGRNLDENIDLQRLESEKSAVQIMTLHASKGLEAHVVFLYGGFSKGRGHQTIHHYHDKGQRIAHIGSDPRVKAQADQMQQDENRRLLYVGMTRAKTRLYLPWVAQDHRPRGFEYAFVRPLADRLQALKDQNEAFKDYFLWKSTRSPKKATQTALQESMDFSLPSIDYDKSEDYFRDLRQAHGAQQVTSYTTLKSKQKLQLSSTNEDFYEIYENPEEDSPSGKQYGILLHEMIEKIDFKTFVGSPDLSRWSKDIRTQVTQLMTQYGIEKHYLKQTLKLVYETLTTPIKTPYFALENGFSQIQEGRKEMEFIYPIQADKGYVKGYVDYVFKIENKLWFIDWKSDQLEDYQSEALKTHVESHYQVQTELYSLALSKILNLKNDQDWQEKFGGLIFVFLRGMKEHKSLHIERPTWDQLDLYEKELSREIQFK